MFKEPYSRYFYLIEENNRLP